MNFGCHANITSPSDSTVAMQLAEVASAWADGQTQFCNAVCPLAATADRAFDMGTHVVVARTTSIQIFFVDSNQDSSLQP